MGKLERCAVDRLTRGFHRLGLVVAVPLGLIAVLFGAGAAFSPRSADAASIAMFAAGFAIVAYAAARAIAWIINGFRETI